MNLTPREQDTTGLSYKLVRPVAGFFTITSIEAVNATGILRAVQDGVEHVSVTPIDMPLMPSWIDSRENSDQNPHIFTLILIGISVRIGGAQSKF